MGGELLQTSDKALWPARRRSIGRCGGRGGVFRFWGGIFETDGDLGYLEE